MNLESEIDSVSVVAGQQQSKARLMHQDPGCKESPILSSGFQSACSNKWSSYNMQSNPGQEMYSQAQIMTMNNNNAFKYQNFYTENMQSQPQSLVKPLGLSSNLKSNRGPGSVNSGSVVTKNCVCLNSMTVLKAVKHMWEGGANKSVMAATDHSGGGGSGGGGAEREVEPVSTTSIRNQDIKSIVSVNSTTCRLCGGEQEEIDLYSNNDEDDNPHQHHSMKMDAPATTSGSSASGSSGNVTRNIQMPVYHMQNPPPVIGSGIVLPDASQYPMHNSPPPSYQQSMAIGTILGKNQSIMAGDNSSNQFSLAISNGILNENSSSGFFSDGVDKCD